ncbi:HSP20-like chaperone [Flammula alnicola]|nr:HSP20-like chaperone [Flammula alnicola]
MSSQRVFLYEPFYDFERLLDDTSTARAPGPSKAIEGSGAVRAIKPKMDLHENSKTNLVTATFELPGLKKDNVDIEVHNQNLTVSGESTISSEREEGDYAFRERQFGKFSRTLQLPPGVKENQIKAHMDNGVLTVTFPKASPEHAHKKITVN